MALQRDGLGTLIRLLDPEDYRFVRTQDPTMESRFRRERMKIYRGGLRAVARYAAQSYHARLANLSSAGMWRAYPSLLLSTASSFFSIGKLWMAGALFRLRLPVVVDVAAQRERLRQFLTSQAPSV